MSFAKQYRSIITGMLAGSNIVEQHNERTGEVIRTMPGGLSWGFWIANRMAPMIDLRRTYIKTAAAEAAWFLQGTQDTSWIKKHCRIWEKFEEPVGFELDGQTHMMGVKNAYGYRYRNHFGRDQLLDAVNALHMDPTNRQIYISAWDPSRDGLLNKGEKNVPCPASFTLNIINGQLHSSYFLRSSDLFVGLPYDMLTHSLLVTAMADTLGIQPGFISVLVGHAHLYKKHQEMAAEALKRTDEAPMIYMERFSMSDIEREPDDYVAHYNVADSRAVHPLFNCRPEVVA
ncbi:thymidylate synthase [Achromobacter xylosoxidans]|uniref:thymidylate synthase n=1 Tax=Achromobacter phage JWX TaxID=1589746 RepID=A0A0B5A530_9CAUD|nr:thymidylate synthase [Achromobacter xylosoxidans]YP_009196224.1 thymidylate synthase [Achromobacter phage JWX]AJD82805.1 thymidylate synthase [Achromobacter phage JWX]WLW38458.1 thymidylate synthase [Achromobacter phage JWT]